MGAFWRFFLCAVLLLIVIPNGFISSTQNTANISSSYCSVWSCQTPADVPFCLVRPECGCNVDHQCVLVTRE